MQAAIEDELTYVPDNTLAPVDQYKWLWTANEIYLTQAEATLVTKYASEATQGILELGRGGSTLLLTSSSNVPVISVDSHARMSPTLAEALKKAPGSAIQLVNEASYKIDMSDNKVDVMLVGQNINDKADGAYNALIGLINHYWPALTGHALFYNYKVHEKTTINTAVNMLTTNGIGEAVDQVGNLIVIKKLKELT